nr:MAG TPA: hypothetical protein [Caudoviricetes sp.]
MHRKSKLILSNGCKMNMLTVVFTIRAATLIVNV